MIDAYRRGLLLETLFSLEMLLWWDSSTLDQRQPDALTSSEICLFEFCRRSAAVIRDVLNDDNARRGPRPMLKPPDLTHYRKAAQQAQHREINESLSTRGALEPSRAPPDNFFPPVNEDDGQYMRWLLREDEPGAPAHPSFPSHPTRQP